MEFNSLPAEVQVKIFSYLPVRMVMKIRGVCKQWNRLINSEVKFKRLLCRQYSASPLYTRYDFGFESTRVFLDYVGVDRKYNRVKYLFCELHPNPIQLEDAFDFLNSFRFLENVWLTCRVPDRYRIDWRVIETKQFVVSLPQLERGNLFFYLEGFVSKVSVVLDLPSLFCLGVDSLKGLTIKYPEKLRTLQTRELFLDELQTSPDYSKFTSLTRIYTVESNVRSITTRFIEKLPNLIEIHLNNYFIPYRLPPEPSSDNTAPRIFHFGFEMSVDQINSEGQLWWNHFMRPTEASAFLVQNLHRSCDNNRQLFNRLLHPSIDYNTIARELNDTEMFEVMPRKLPNIRRIDIIGAVTDPHRLFKFIGRFKIEELYLRRTSLPRWFFKKLPENGRFLRVLRIRREGKMSILSGDFDFVFKFENLNRLHIDNCRLSLNFVVRLLKELKCIKRILFDSKRPEELYFSFFYDVTRILLRTESGLIIFEFPGEQPPEFMDELSSRLKANGFVRPQKLIAMLRHVQLERETHLFWMRKFIYEQRHFIGLSRETLCRRSSAC